MLDDEELDSPKKLLILFFLLNVPRAIPENDVYKSVGYFFQ
jgi:hypothetical protein